MKKSITIILIIFIIIVGIGFYYYMNNKSNNTNNYEAQKTVAEKNTTGNQTFSNKSTTNNVSNQIEGAQTSQPAEPAPTPAPENTPKEEEIASFSTKIYTKDSSRQNNITLTCSALNDTDVENGETFSFCNTVGRSSPSKGYTKADIFTDGKKTKGYGGGNCQVSTTLYNAVLKVDGLKVTERHEHSNSVPYIQSGKDAAVAYGSYDFKFVNNTGSSIRIKASHTADSVSVRLIKLV